MTAGEGTLRIRVLGDITQFQGAMQGLSGSLSSLGSQLTGAGRSITMLTAPLAAIGGGAIKTGMEFDSSFAKIQGLVGVADKDIGQLREGVLALAGQTAKSPLELADALFFVTSAGLRGKEALDVLEISAKGSAAGLGETKDVAGLLTSVINAYGSENITAARAGDILTATIREGKLETDSLAAVMGPLLPLAAAMGISFEDLGGQYAVMSRTGAEAAGITTSLQAIMTTMLKPTAGASQALADVGLSMADLRGVAAGPEGLIGVMRLLEERFRGNDEGLAKVIPNVRAFRGVMSVLAQDAGDVSGVIERVADSTGFLDHAFATAADTAEFKFKQAMANGEVALLKVWEVIKGPVSDALDSLAQLLSDAGDWFAGLDEGTQGWLVGISALLVVLGPLLIILGLLAGGLGAIVGLLGLLFSPIALVVLAIAAFVLGIGWLLNEFGLLDDVINVIMGVFEAFMGIIRDLGYQLGGLIGVIVDVIGAIIDFGDAAIRILSGDFEGAVAAAERGMARVESAGVNMARVLLDENQRAVDAATAAAQEYEARMGRLSTNMVSHADEVTSTYSTLATTTTDATDEVTGALTGMGDVTDAEVTRMLAELGLVPGGFEGIGDAAQETAPRVEASLSQITGALGGLYQSSRDAWQNFKDAAKDGTEDPEARIEKLSARLDKLNKEDLASLGPSALAAWADAKFATEQELGGLTYFVENKSDIIATLLPDALADANRDSATQWGEILGTGQRTMEQLPVAIAPGIDDAVGVVGAIPGRFAEELTGGVPQVSAAAGSLTTAVDTAIAPLPGIAGTTGSEGGSAFASGIDATEQAATNAGSALRVAALDEFHKMNLLAEQAGQWAGQKFASGLSDRQDWVAGAAAAVRAAAQAVLSNVEWARQSGLRTINAYADGIRAGTAAAVAAARNVATQVQRILKASSPPGPESPLHDIDKWGYRTILAWADGAQQALSRVVDTVSGVMGAASGAIEGRVMAAAAPLHAVPAMAGTTNTFNITVQTGIGDPVAIGQEVRRVLDSYMTYGERG